LPAARLTWCSARVISTHTVDAAQATNSAIHGTIGHGRVRGLAEAQKSEDRTPLLAGEAAATVVARRLAGVLAEERVVSNAECDSDEAFQR